MFECEQEWSTGIWLWELGSAVQFYQLEEIGVRIRREAVVLLAK